MQFITEMSAIEQFGSKALHRRFQKKGAGTAEWIFQTRRHIREVGGRKLSMHRHGVFIPMRISLESNWI